MKWLTSGASKSTWSRFARRLVNRRLNWNDLNLGLPPTDVAYLKEFTESLYAAIETGDYERLPYYTEGKEKDEWLMYLTDLTQREREKRSLLRPISLNWFFRMNEEEKSIQAHYEVEGAYRLPDAFLEEFQLDQMPHFTLEIHVNGQLADFFDYAHFTSKHTVFSRHIYHPGDQIALSFTGKERPFMKDGLEWSVPYLLYRKEGQQFVLGNKLGQADSFLLLPEGWSLEKGSKLKKEVYQWEGVSLVGCAIPATYCKEIHVVGPDATLTFAPTVALNWTELHGEPIRVSGVEEVLYDADQCRFFLCSDDDGGARSAYLSDVEFLPVGKNLPAQEMAENATEELASEPTHEEVKAQAAAVLAAEEVRGEWSDTPSYGELLVRAKGDKGTFVAPTRFIHIGGGLTIDVLDADETSCSVHVSWEHGTVTTYEGAEKAENVWLVLKEELVNDRIHFVLTPHEGAQLPFILTVKAPFKGFALYDAEGHSVETKALIPCMDVEKYRYHLIGQSLRSYSYGKRRRELRWIDNKVYIFENKQQIKEVPFEGSLLDLIDTREGLRETLERTSLHSQFAEVRVSFISQSGEKLSVIIKDSPYRLRQEDDRIIVYIDNKKELDFRQNLKLLKLDDPHCPAVSLVYDEEKGYVLPEEIRTWGPSLVMGATGGRVRPAIVALGGALSGEGWVLRKNRIMEDLSQELAASSLGDECWTRMLDWYERIKQEEIPVNVLLDMCSLAQQPDALICLAFQLFVQCETAEEREALAEELTAFSTEMGFSWYWLQPKLNMIMLVIHQHLGDMCSDFMKATFGQWASRKGTDGLKYLEAMKDEEAYGEYFGECMFELMDEFSNWLKAMCLSSLLSQSVDETDEITLSMAQGIMESPTELSRLEEDEESEEFVEYAQDSVDEATKTFFSAYTEGYPGGSGAWMSARVNVVAAHLNGELDLFVQTEEVRRSVIFCRLSCKDDFILELNNKLADR